MSFSEFLPALTALLGVVTGGVISHWNTSADRKARLASERQTSARSAEVGAIIEVMVATQLLTQRANGFRLTTKLLQSRVARRERRGGVLTPLDVEASYDRMVDADQRLSRANAELWLHADAEAVQLGNAVLRAGTEVLEAHFDEPMQGLRSLGRSLRLQYTAAMPGKEERIKESLNSLRSAHTALAEYARGKYGLEPVDLSVVLD
jgi:hypothetical protein